MNNSILDNFSQEEIEEQLKALEKLGWTWEHFNGYDKDDLRKILYPPRKDVRYYWCAEFIPIDKIRTVPHWAFREDALFNLNDKGQKIEDGS